MEGFGNFISLKSFSWFQQNLQLEFDRNILRLIDYLHLTQPHNYLLVGKAVYNSKHKGVPEEYLKSFPTESQTGLLIGMLISAIGGGIIGYNTPYYNNVYYYENQKQFDFTKLNKYARYGSKEPEYLKKIK